MSAVDLDAQPDEVKQFFRSLVVAPEGSLLRMNGRAIVRVLPPEIESTAEEMSEEWTPANNHRRCDLIDKKYDTGLTPPEEAELAILKRGMQKYVDRVAPLPLRSLRKIHQELLEKAEMAGAADSV